eukprot:gene21155-28044_t
MKEDVKNIADRVEPVPEEIVPLALRKNSASVGLFKDEFRAAQRMRNTGGIFIPEVVRTAYPPDKAPHSQAANPAPSYTKTAEQRHMPRKALGPGHLNQPSIQPPRSASRGRHTYDFSETTLNIPGQDYVLARSQRRGSVSPTRRSPSPVKSRPISALDASFQNRLNSASGRPLAASMTNKGTSASQRSTSAHRESGLGSTAASQGHSAMTYTSDSRLPTISSQSPNRGQRPFSAVSDVDDAFFIRDVDEGLANEPSSRPVSSMPKHRNPAMPPGQGTVNSRTGTSTSRATACLSATRYDGLHSKAIPSGRDTKPGQGLPRADYVWNVKVPAGSVITSPSSALSSARQHVRAASASLRKYAMPQTPSAMSTIGTTYARRPKAPYSGDASLPTPSERIASNYTPSARGLSPRMLEFLMPGGIKPGAVGRLPIPEWHEVDGAEILDGAPEADGVMTATRKHMAFMPLELFDNLEYERHSPEEWVQLGAASGGTPAETKIYQVQGGTYEWVPCSVIEWVEEERSFQVLLEGKKPKMVKRLNLRFKAEDPHMFETRILKSKEERDKAEAELRFYFYLDSQTAEDVVHTYDFHKALAKIAGQVPTLQPNVLEPVGRVLIDDCVDYYERGVRRSTLEYRRKDPMEEGRLLVLRLPPNRVKPPASAYGMLSITPDGAPAGLGPSTPFYSLVNWANATAFCAVPSLQNAMTQIEEVATAIREQPLWCLSPITPDFRACVGVGAFSVAEAGRPPYPLDKFEAMQLSHQRQLMQALNIVENSELVEVINSNREEYQDKDAGPSNVQKALLVLTKMKLADAVHSMLQYSAEAYSAHMENYMRLEPVSLDKTGYGGIGEVFSSGALLKQLKPPPDSDEEVGESPEEEKQCLIQLVPSMDAVRNVAAGQFVAVGERPEEEKQCLIQLVPSMDAVRTVAAGQFGDMFDSMTQIMDPYTAYGYEDKQLCGVDEWLKDAQLAKCRKRVHNVVEEGISR